MSECSGQQGHASIPMTHNYQLKVIAENLSGVKHKIFVMSGKGGVGKSSVTVNLAVALAMRGNKVGILDVDIHGPSVPHLLGCEGQVLADDAGRLLPVRCPVPGSPEGGELSYISIESFLPEKDSAVVWRGPKKTSAIQQFLSDVKWGALDYLVIDSPPGTGDEHMTIMDCIPDARCVVVTTPQEISLADVRKALDFLQLVKAPVLGIVENMSYLLCPDCGREIPLFGQGRTQAAAEAHGLKLLARMPLDPSLAQLTDQGRIEDLQSQWLVPVAEAVLS